MSVGQEGAEVFVATTIFHEDRQDGAVVQAEFAADDGSKAELLGFHFESRHAVEPVAVAEGDGGDFQFGGSVREDLGERSAPEEAEGAGGVELGVEHGRVNARNLPSS